MKNMKKMYLLAAMAACSSAFAQSNTVVRWRGLAGVITAAGVDNPIGDIHSGAGPWIATGGSAAIDLATGEGSFDVDGLVLNGGPASGTPGGVTSVVGTLVCNPSSAAGSDQTATNTPITPLSRLGDAELSFTINIPQPCSNPLFLIRTPGGRWIATATRPVVADSRTR